MGAATGNTTASTAELLEHLASTRRSSSRRRWIVQLLLLGSLATAVVVVTAVAQNAERAKSGPQVELVGFKGLDALAACHLSPRYADANGDLLADTPADASNLCEPASIVMAHYVGDDIGRDRVDWNALQAHLERTIGKPVQLQKFRQSAEQIEAVATGKVHLVTSHAAEIPSLVNQAGLIPFAVLGNPDGADGNRLVIAVPRNSAAKSLDDLRGKSLICTGPESITGYRAAVVAIAKETGMKPNVDYDIRFSKTQERSVTVLAVGQLDFAAVSNDVLTRMVARQKIGASEYRILYESQVIPRITAGYIHNLEPELASRLVSAFLSFENQPAPSQDSVDAAEDDDLTPFPTGFIPIQYQRDLEFLRNIDAAFVPRFEFLPGESVISAAGSR